MKKFILPILVLLFIALSSFYSGINDKETSSGVSVQNFSPNSYADSGRYFPLKPGNKFFYKYKFTFHYFNPDSIAYDSGYYVSRITDTIRKNGILYYKINTFIVDTAVGYFRFDSDSGYLNVYNSSGTCSFDLRYFKLASVLNEWGLGPCSFNDESRKCIALSDTALFGFQKSQKIFYNIIGGTFLYSYRSTFVKDIGLTQYVFNFSSPFPQSIISRKYDLIGACVNGIKYGDTIMAGIKSISNEIPSEYKLYQNYPNPFNSTTNIKYQITNKKWVILKVYDILGKEIETLVNEKQSPGTYEVAFDGSKYSSGIYFYRLATDEFKETKKLVLLK
jgi:hypothetical protein